MLFKEYYLLALGEYSASMFLSKYMILYKNKYYLLGYELLLQK